MTITSQASGIMKPGPSLLSLGSQYFLHQSTDTKDASRAVATQPVATYNVATEIRTLEIEPLHVYMKSSKKGNSS